MEYDLFDDFFSSPWNEASLDGLETQSSSALNDSRSEDSMQSNDRTALNSSELKCAPCEKSFSTNRALTRHLRENKRHRTEDEQSERLFKCPLCPVTCARIYDLRRHKQTQHSDSMTVCISCGSRYRPGTQHEEQCAAWLNSRMQTADMLNNAAEALACTLGSNTETESMDLAAASYAACDTLSTSKPVQYGLYMPANRTRIICGHCHKCFEDSTHNNFKHLQAHRKELKEQYKCVPCNLGFVRKKDFEHHNANARQGLCGFSFDHVLPCGGHHPEFCIDYKAFYCCVREWEHSQLQLFVRSVSRLLEQSGSDPQQVYSVPTQDLGGRRSDPRPATVPANVDYVQEMGALPDVFDSLGLADDRTTKWSTKLQKAVAANSSWHIRNLLQDTVLDDHVSSRIHSCIQDALNLKHYIAAETLLPYISARHNDSRSSELLHHQIRRNDDKGVSLLLDHGANVNQSDPKGHSPLQVAARRSSLEIVKCLLSKGAAPNKRNGKGELPLSLAIAGGREDVVQCLLEHGADPNLPFCGLSTALHEAVKKDSGVLVRLLLDRGGKKSIWDSKERTPRQLAMSLNHKDALRAFLMHDGVGADLPGVLLDCDSHYYKAVFAAGGL